MDNINHRFTVHKLTGNEADGNLFIDVIYQCSGERCPVLPFKNERAAVLGFIPL